MLKTLRINQKEVEVPSHMSCLQQDVVDSISAKEDFKSRVIAAGVNPSDKSLVFITGDVDIREIHPNGQKIPHDAVPSGDGCHITMTFEDVDRIYAIESKLAIENSVSCLSDMTLTVNNVVIGNLDMSSDE